MENSVHASTGGSSGQIVVAGAGYAGLHVTLRLTAKLRNHPKVMPTLVGRRNYHRALTELPRVAGGSRAAAGRGANGCARGHQRHNREAILAGDRDDEAMSKENAMAVICGITRDKRQHGKDSS
jgi:hypothetical protein